MPDTGGPPHYITTHQGSLSSTGSLMNACCDNFSHYFSFFFSVVYGKKKSQNFTLLMIVGCFGIHLGKLESRSFMYFHYQNTIRGIIEKEFRNAE